MPFSRQTITRQVEDTAGSLKLQLQNKADNFDLFPMALDRSKCPLNMNINVCLTFSLYLWNHFYTVFYSDIIYIEQN